MYQVALDRLNDFKNHALFRPLAHHLAVGSVLSGRSNGAVYVDDPLNPAAAVLWSGTRIYLAGTVGEPAPNSHLDTFFMEQLWLRVKKAGLEGFLLYLGPGWASTINEDLVGIHLHSGQRHYYSLQSTEFEENYELPGNCQLRRVDWSLLEVESLANRALLMAEMKSERPSIADFLAKSFGYCIVQEQTIAAWCLSEYNLEDRCEVGIMTAEGHRRRGLAKITAAALIEEARQRGITRIGWHCWADNLPSRATAQALGFQLIEVYPAAYGSGQDILPYIEKQPGF